MQKEELEKEVFHAKHIFFDLHEQEDHLLQQIDTFLHEQVFPNHSTTSFQIKRLTGGITNRIYKITFLSSTTTIDNTIDSNTQNTQNTQKKNKILIRINGLSTEKIIDRNIELFHMLQIYKNNLGPKIYCVFKNGYIYDYIEGECCYTFMELSEHAEKIAENLAKFHKVNILQYSDKEKLPNLFLVLNKWINNVKEFTNCNENCNENTTNHIENHVENKFGGWQNEELKLKFEKLNFNKICNEIKTIENFFTKKEKHVANPNNLNDVLNSFTIGFCHNDLLALNVLYNKEEDKINFIDYEYCAYNYRGFDIGNHFDEYAGAELDRSVYPNEDLQYLFIKRYLLTFYEPIVNNNNVNNNVTNNNDNNNNNNNNNKVSDEEKEKVITDEAIRKFMKSIKLFSCLGQLYWGLWGISQARYSDIDFDFLDFTKKRFDWFYDDYKDINLDEL